MAQELATQGAVSSTPSRSELHSLILRCDNEGELGPGEFAELEAFAAEPCPVFPLITQEEFRRIIAPLALALKQQRTTDQDGKLLNAAYWAALKDVSAFRVKRAAAHFLKTAEWMPTPGQVRIEALRYIHDTELAHVRARRLVRERHHRLTRTLLNRIARQELDQGELDALTEEVRREAVTRGLAVPTPEGGMVYRTRETVERWTAHNRQLMLGSQGET